MPHPWETGDPTSDWQGYFIPGADVLRNRVGATTKDELRDAENDLVEARLIELRESPELLGSRTYDLRFLSATHLQIFQDVYAWAGQLRTIGIEKDGESFCSPDSIARAMAHAEQRIAELDQLREVGDDDLPAVVAYLYDYVNFAHPFREGNGRCTREFFDLLLAERGNGLDWEQVESADLYSACHAARAEQNLHGLEVLFDRIIDTQPAYDF